MCSGRELLDGEVVIAGLAGRDAFLEVFLQLRALAATARISPACLPAKGEVEFAGCPG